MKIKFRGNTMRFIYDERFQLGAAGQMRVERASQVEIKGQLPWWAWVRKWRLRNISQGRWYADMWLSGGPILGPFDTRTQALEEEVRWLEKHWL